MLRIYIPLVATIHWEKVDKVTRDKEIIESARNWDVKAKYEHTLTKYIDGFLAIQYQGNEFSGYKQRENIDLGAKYILKNTDKTQSFFELGARYTIEMKVVRDDKNEDVFNFSKGRLYYEIVHKKSEDLSYKFWIEYLPNFTESEDYLITYEPSVAFILSNTFSLKTAYKAMYDNLPNIEGNKYTDYTFTTSLLAKF